MASHMLICLSLKGRRERFRKFWGTETSMLDRHSAAETHAQARLDVDFQFPPLLDHLIHEMGL